MDQETEDQFRQRREASPDVDWEGVYEWVARAYDLTRPGGVIALVLPDRRPFTARKPRVDE